MQGIHRLKYRLRKGDEVIVTTGKSKGETGLIEKISHKHGKVYVSGVNLYTKHEKPSQTSPGGISNKAMPLDISNVAFLDPKKKKATRIGYKIENGKKTRFAKLSGTLI